MSGRCKQTLMRIPLISSALRYLNNTMVPHPWDLRHSTIWSMHRNFPDREQWKATKLDASHSLIYDRINEVKIFFGFGWLKLLAYFARNGTPNTHYFKWRMEQAFENSGLGKQGLKETYARLSFMYALRLMLGYHRYGLGEKIEALHRDISPEGQDMRILDYGCGVADPALLLAVRGARATIIDLEDKKFEFAQWRFSTRKLPVTAVAAIETERPVKLVENYNVIIMSEFLEHVRSPQLFLEFAANHLDKGGILYDSLGPEHHASTGGDHLPETKAIIESPEYMALHSQLFAAVNKTTDGNNYNGFYLKK